MKKVRGSFLSSDQTKERRNNSVEGGKEKKRKEKKKRRQRKERRKKEKKGRKERNERIKNPCVEENGERKEKCSDSWKSIGQELKLVYSTRATSRCQKKKKEVGFSPTLVPLYLRAINGRMVQPQPKD